MVTSFELKVEINGRNEFTSISGFSLTQSIDWHHTFELKVPLDDVESQGTDTLNSSRDFIGKAIKIEITDGHNHKCKFNGVITDIALHRFGGRSSNLVLKGYSPTVILEHGINTRMFANANLSAIFNLVTNRYPREGITYHVNPSPNPSRDMTIQYKESSYNFLARLANRYGQWFFFDGKDCYFGSLPSSEAINLQFGSNLSDFSLGARISATKFNTKAYDYANNETYSSGPQSLNGLDNLGRHAFSQSENYFFEEQNFNTSMVAKSQTDITDYAKARRAGIAANLVNIRGRSIEVRLKPGAQVSVQAEAGEATSHSSNYGSYTITAVTHYIDGTGNYENSFEAIPSSLTVPPPNKNVREPLCETQPAVVTHNADPDGMGRVKVKFYWDPQAETPWLRIVTPNAGKNRGVHFLPEVNDEVMITFEGNNPDLPMVIGSIYHSKANHSDRKDDSNYIKTIRTESGNEIKFTDKGGEEEILIMNKEDNNKILLSLKQDGQIVIQSKGKIEMKAKEMDINVEKDLTIKAMNIKINADQKMNVEAKQELDMKSTNVKMNADANMDLEATANMNLKANAKMDIDGGGMANIHAKGQMSVNSTGQTEVKGSIVMIN